MSVRSLQIRAETLSGEGVGRAARFFEAEELKGWLPVDTEVEDGRPLLRWLDMRGARLAEPFFQQTVERVRGEKPRRAELFTELDALLQLEKIVDHLRPDGFIFHSSRCGSTLVSNACGALDGALVVSEAAPADKLIWDYLAHDEEGGTRSLLRRAFFRAVVNILGQRRAGDERRYFVKFSCCSILRLSFIRRIWQDVPWVFVHRDPVEVMVSNLRNVPEWMRFESQPAMAAAVCGIDEAGVVGMSREEFCARALGRFYEAAAEAAGPGAMLVGYEDLAGGKLAEIVRFFGAEPTAAEAGRVAEVSGFYAKDATPTRRFEPDGEEKRASAPARVREAVERWAAEPYRRLLAKQSTPAGRRAV